MNAFTWLRRSPRLTVAIAVVGIAAVAAAVAFAATGPAIQTSTPHFADQVTNIDVLRQQIRNYYGDPLGTGVFGTDSNYAREADFVADQGDHWLAARAHAHYPSGMKAIVLDVDDTTLATWNYEVFSNWDYNPTTNATFVTGMLFPAVPGMVDMVQQAKAEGYTIIWITGRPTSQEAPTLGNLTKTDVGYPAPTALRTASSRSRRSPTIRRTCRPRAPSRSRPASRARPSTTSRRRGATSSRSATTSSPTSATSSATSPAASRIARSRCRTRTTSCRSGAV